MQPPFEDETGTPKTSRLSPGGRAYTHKLPEQSKGLGGNIGCKGKTDMLGRRGIGWLLCAHETKRADAPLPAAGVHYSGV